MKSLAHNLIIDLAAVLIILSTSLCSNREALGNRQTNAGHLANTAGHFHCFIRGKFEPVTGEPFRGGLCRGNVTAYNTYFNKSVLK